MPTAAVAVSPYAFISYSTPDFSFVELLVRLLEFHRVRAWSSALIPTGAEFPPQIDEALKEATVLLVAVSKHSAESNWVTREVTTYLNYHPAGLILPLRLDDTNPKSIYDGLEYRQRIDFEGSFVHGFERLFKEMGREFLKASERRGPDRRGSVGDRRHKLTTVRRVRFGFWQHYERATGNTRSDALTAGIRHLYQIRDAVLDEALKYDYTTTAGEPVTAEMALQDAIDRVGEEFQGRHMPAIHLVHAVAEALCYCYVVVSIDRRHRDRRVDLPPKGGS